MAIYDGIHYQDATVELDGNTFQNCTFDRCTMVYRGNDLPYLISSVFNNCQFRFDDAALRTITLLHRLYAAGAEKIVEEYIEMIKSGTPPAALSAH
jgi:hypothetical protein